MEAVLSSLGAAGLPRPETPVEIDKLNIHVVASQLTIGLIKVNFSLLYIDRAL